MTAKKSIRNERTTENREYWKFVDDVVSDVATWPAWKRGGSLVRDAAVAKSIREDSHSAGSVASKQAAKKKK